MNIGLGVAFLAGLATFFSPCVLPIVPGYLAVLSGDRGHILRRIILFSLGIVLAFTALGGLLAILGGIVVQTRDLLIKGLGVLLIFFGIQLLYPLPFFGKELRIKLTDDQSDLSALALGAAFGIAWTPCSGVILGLVVAQALLSNTQLAVPLFLAYSLGLVLPMLAIAYFFKLSGRLVKFPKSLPRLVNITVAFLVIVLGIGMATGWINYWRAAALTQFPNLESGLLPLVR